MPSAVTRYTPFEDTTMSVAKSLAPPAFAMRSLTAEHSAKFFT
jgi:hypothetical protein